MLKEKISENEVPITIAQINVIPGRPDLNVKKMLEKINLAKLEGSEIIIFSEMVISGYILGDEWENEKLVKDFFAYNQEIIEASKDITIVWGNVDIDENKKGEDGRMRKYNAGFMAQNRKLIQKIAKSAMPSYGEFDDERHFYSLQKLANESGENIENLLNPIEITLNGVKRKIGVVLCEDQWASGENSDYAINPVKILCEKNAEAIINLSCSPWKQKKNKKRHEVIQESVRNFQVPVIYGNNTGTQNDVDNSYVFDGSSTIYNADGSIQKMGNFFEEDLVSGVLDFPLRHCEESGGQNFETKQSISKSGLPRRSKVSDELITPRKDEQIDLKVEELKNLQEIHKALVFGIQEFFKSRPNKKVVIGLSGGLDSALVATLLVEALGEENIYAVNMPTKFNSGMTKNLAEDLAQELGINYSVVPIQEIVDLTRKDLDSVEFSRHCEESDVEISETKQSIKNTGLPRRDKITDKLITPRKDGQVRPENNLTREHNPLLSDTYNKTSVNISDFDFQNIQARDRGGRVLAGISAGLGAVFTNNGNKTETGFGYATLYGDVNGAIAPIADLYKTQVQDLSRFLSEKLEIPSLQKIVDIPPSAELDDSQNVEEGKGDPFFYEYHDKLLETFVEKRKDPEDILEAYISGNIDAFLGLEKGVTGKYFSTAETFILDLEEKFRMFKIPVFKRGQAPMILRVSKRGFGHDLRETLRQDPDGKIYYTKNYQTLRDEILGKSPKPSLTRGLKKY